MLTSIVIVTYNKLEYTKQCIESVRQHTMAGSYELIVVDNGSADGTTEWAEEQGDVTLIANEENYGFPRACNQGLERATGELLLLLNNDTIVTARWLEGLKAALLSSPGIGAVGPVTNAASYLTSIQVPYTTEVEMHAFAEAYNRTDSARWEERLKLIGFCLLMKREAYEKAGPLDEQFGIGNYEDDDISLRIWLAGYKLLLCRDTFIHHYGSVSFGENLMSFQETLITNAGLFVRKWGFRPELALNIRTDMLAMVEEAFPQHRPLRILEVGCGCGGTLLALKHRYPGSELYGAERLEPAVRIASAAGISAYQSGRPDEWAIPDESLDVLLIGDAHAYAALTALLCAAVSKLRSGGWIAAGFANRRFYRYSNRIEAGEAIDPSLLITVDQASAVLRAAGVGGLQAAYALEPESERDAEALAAARCREAERAADELSASYFIVTGRRAAPVNQPRDEADHAVQPEGTDPSAAGAATEALTALKEQNDVMFTGERLVVNAEVKSQYRDVYDEHMVRYAAASRYVSGKLVLDAACGTGYGSLMLREAGAAAVVGVDIDSEAIRMAQRDYGKEGIVFMQGDVLKLPFADNAFDAVVSFETIEHVEEGLAWIKESARVLRPGGLFIVSTPNRAVTNASNYYEDAPSNPHHRFEYRTGELLGDLLREYVVEELYGQNWVDDSRFAAMRWLRQANDRPFERDKKLRIEETGSKLLPFHLFRSGEPTYIVVVCRKRTGGADG